MKINYIVANDRDPEGWTENYEFDGDGDAEEIIRALIERFNATLKPHELPRRLVKILSFSFIPKEPKPVEHIWSKVSLVTERGGYDRMKCRACGATGKRYGLGQFGVAVDKRARKSCPGYDL